MQVFKLYFKVLKSQLSIFIMYTVIFLTIVIGIVIPARTNGDTASYKDQKVKFALMDEDNSTLSKGLDAHLSEADVKVTIKDFEKETLQDELYARNIRAAVVIEKGFEEGMKNGKSDEYLKIYDIPDNSASQLFTSEVTEYLRYVNGYLTADYSMDKAVEKASQITMKTADVSIEGSKDIVNSSNATIYFQYLGWIIVVMLSIAIAPILVVINKDEVRARIECSSFEFSKTNLQILLGVFVTGLAVCGVFGIVAKIFFKEGFAGTQALLYMGNTVCYAAVALGIAFVFSKVTDKIMVINMIGNVVALGMSFLCGVFVPQYLLSEGVLKIAHFLPTYWYLGAIERIELYTADKLPEILQCFGIQILFAVVIIIIGLVIGNAKRRKA